MHFYRCADPVMCQHSRLEMEAMSPLDNRGTPARQRGCWGQSSSNLCLKARRKQRVACLEARRRSPVCVPIAFRADAAAGRSPSHPQSLIAALCDRRIRYRELHGARCATRAPCGEPSEMGGNEVGHVLVREKFAGVPAVRLPQIVQDATELKNSAREAVLRNSPATSKESGTRGVTLHSI